MSASSTGRDFSRMPSGTNVVDVVGDDLGVAVRESAEEVGVGHAQNRWSHGS